MLWQTNRIKHRQLHRRRLQLRRAAKAVLVVRAADTVVTVVAEVVAKAVLAVGAGKAAQGVLAAVPVDLAAGSANFSARRKSANSASKRWI